MLKSIRHGFEPNSRSRERSILPIDCPAIVVWVVDTVGIWVRNKADIDLGSICTLGCQYGTAIDLKDCGFESLP